MYIYVFRFSESRFAVWWCEPARADGKSREGNVRSALCNLSDLAPLPNLDGTGKAQSLETKFIVHPAPFSTMVVGKSLKAGLEWK
jgi:hypothetical protein